MTGRDRPPEPACGALVPGGHVLALRVYYEDTDAGGVVYHASYLRFAERTRTEYLRCLGIEQTALRDGPGVLFAVRRCEIDYLRPARLGHRQAPRGDPHGCTLPRPGSGHPHRCLKSAAGHTPVSHPREHAPRG